MHLTAPIHTGTDWNELIMHEDKNGLAAEVLVTTSNTTFNPNPRSDTHFEEVPTTGDDWRANLQGYSIVKLSGHTCTVT